MKIIIYIITLLLLAYSKVHAQPIVQQRLSIISSYLDTMLFVKRFESIQTPCLCISEGKNQIAIAPRNTINSNYRIRLHADSTIIDSGVACLSKHYSQYMRFKPTNYDTLSETIYGDLQFSYSYSASSIIQYLGLNTMSNNNSSTFFNNLISNKGVFKLYPENDKYRFEVKFSNSPFNKNDIFHGYIEIIEGSFGHKKACNIFFDAINLDKGDNNNQIFVKFTSTNFNLESEYYIVLLYNTLKFEQSTNISKRAEALWTKSFFSNSACNACQFIYSQAENMLLNNVIPLPNTEPAPAH